MIGKSLLWNRDQSAVLNALAEWAAADHCNMLEIGSWLGDSTVMLGQIAKKRNGRLYCVDWWKGSAGTKLHDIAIQEDVFTKFWNRICGEGLDEYVIPIHTKSELAADILTKSSFDFIFIDGDHRYSTVKSDITLFAPILKNGGILCGHDCEGYIADYDLEFLHKGKETDYYETVHCGVVLAAGESFQNYAINQSIWNTLKVSDGVWKKPDVPLEQIANCKQTQTPPAGCTTAYYIWRFWKTLYAIPFSYSFDGNYIDDLNYNELLFKASSISELELLIKEEFFALPQLIEMNYKNFNILHFRNMVLAVSTTLGHIEIPKLSYQKTSRYSSEGLYFEGNSIEDVKHRINQSIENSNLQVIMKLENIIRQLETKLTETEMQLRERLDVSAEITKTLENIIEENRHQKYPSIFVERYGNYNIVNAKNKYFALSLKLGDISLFNDQYGDRELQDLLLYQENIDLLKLKIDAIDRNRQQKDDLITFLEKHSRELESECQLYKQQSAAFDSQRKEQHAILEQQSALLADKEAHLDDLQARNAAFEKTLHSFEISLQDKNNLLDTLSLANNGLTEKNKELKAERIQLEKENKSLQKKAAEINEICEYNAAQLAMNKNVMTSLQNTNCTLQSDYIRLESEYKKVSGDLLKYKEIVITLESRIYNMRLNRIR